VNIQGDVRRPRDRGPGSSIGAHRCGRRRRWRLIRLEPRDGSDNRDSAGLVASARQSAPMDRSTCLIPHDTEVIWSFLEGPSPLGGTWSAHSAGEMASRDAMVGRDDPHYTSRNRGRSRRCERPHRGTSTSARHVVPGVVEDPRPSRRVAPGMAEPSDHSRGTGVPGDRRGRNRRGVLRIGPSTRAVVRR